MHKDLATIFKKMRLRYPLDEAAKVALRTAAEFVSQHGQPKLVRFVLFDKRALATFHDAMGTLRGHGSGK